MESHEEFANRLLGAPQDQSLPILQDLLGQGYDTVTWRTNIGATDAPCIARSGDTWPLAEFLSGLRYAAPIFEKTHVGCKCAVEVTGPGKTTAVLTAFGRES